MTEKESIAMKLVYVAGPYRAATPRGIVENIRRAEALALRVWKAGAACVCPHLNTALLDGAADDSVWLSGDLEIIRRSDALVLVEGWERSNGTREEIALARSLGLPVFVEFDGLLEWLGA